MDVEKVDFVSFLTRDIARAKYFYADLMILHRRYAPFADGRRR